ncbi:hypothetical protein [Lutibaculum baratangense]|uniref:Uncharacterized protein n=1 Tax=Lutibaculum baratangense AMV1 TaxID=631454 RepID=V4RMQ8_9HYPH|nr:hypothetical protein [Lutibaculum baratangense]ESR26564.1 hypothetical protein N177_0783 [Lutibaculum baratangense AMV1]
MHRDAEPSYLRVTFWALAFLVGTLLVTALFGGFEPIAIAAR